MAEVDEQDTFITGTSMSVEDEKAQRLRANLNAADPEHALLRPADALLGSSMGDALANVVQEAAQQQEAAARKKTQGIEEGAEEHWNLVMKKLAPAGYKKSPQWQKGIIDRVIKKMAGRQTKGEGNPLTQGPSSERATVERRPRPLLTRSSLSRIPRPLCSCSCGRRWEGGGKVTR